MKPFHTASVLIACGGDIYSRRINAAMTEDIRKLCYILFYSVEGSCKEMP